MKNIIISLLLFCCQKDPFAGVYFQRTIWAIWVTFKQTRRWSVNVNEKCNCYFRFALLLPRFFFFHFKEFEQRQRENNSEKRRSSAASTTGSNMEQEHEEIVSTIEAAAMFDLPDTTLSDFPLGCLVRTIQNPDKNGLGTVLKVRNNTISKKEITEETNSILLRFTMYI